MHTFFNAYGTNNKNSHKMTILDNISNKTLKRAYVCPSLEVITSEEEPWIVCDSVTGEVKDTTPGDDRPGDNEEIPAKQGFFNPNMFTDEDFEDY